MKLSTRDNVPPNQIHWRRFFLCFLLYRCVYPYRSRDSLSPVCGIFFLLYKKIIKEFGYKFLWLTFSNGVRYNRSSLSFLSEVLSFLKGTNKLTFLQSPSSYDFGVTVDMWHLTPDMWHVTQDMCHMTHSWWWTLCKKIQVSSSNGFGVMMFWRFGGKGWIS